MTPVNTTPTQKKKEGNIPKLRHYNTREEQRFPIKINMDMETSH